MRCCGSSTPSNRRASATRCSAGWPWPPTGSIEPPATSTCSSPPPPPDERNIERLRNALSSVFDDPDILQITAGDLGGDYPAVQYGPPGVDQQEDR